MAEAIVVLTPDVRREQIVQRSYRSPPREMARNLKPLGVLVEHRVHNVNEGLVTGKKSVAASQQITFQPALALMFAQHLHDTPIRGNMIVPGQDFGGRTTAGDFEERVP